MEQFDDTNGAESARGDAAGSVAVPTHTDEATAVNRVSAHPEATIPDSEYSLAEIEQRRARPVRWVVFALAVLLAIVIPYGYGRSLAINHTQGVLHYASVLDPRGIALIAWTVTVLTFMGIAMSIIESSSWFWRVVFVLGLAAEQLIAGLCLLKMNFWYSTFVVYQHQAILANAANLGIIAAGGLRHPLCGHPGLRQEGFPLERADPQLVGPVHVLHHRAYCHSYCSLRWSHHRGLIRRVANS